MSTTTHATSWESQRRHAAALSLAYRQPRVAREISFATCPHCDLPYRAGALHECITGAPEVPETPNSGLANRCTIAACASSSSRPTPCPSEGVGS